MDPRKITYISGNILIFAGQIAVLIVCIIFIGFMYEENIAPDKKVAEDFGVSNCRILSKTLSTAGRVIHRYRADFLVTYLAGGVAYRSIASANGLDYSFSTDINSQQEFLDEFDVESTYPCWYDPQHPAIVVLVLRHSWTSTFPLLVPSVIALIMLFYIGKTIIQVLEAMVAIRNQRR